MSELESSFTTHTITDGRRRYCTHGHGRTRCRAIASNWIDYGKTGGRFYLCPEHYVSVQQAVMFGRSS